MPKFDKDQDRTAEPRWAETLRYDRLRQAVYREVIHQSWGCQLWTVERLGHITKDMRDAGDCYFRAYHSREKSETALKYYEQLRDVMGRRCQSWDIYGEPWKERRIAHEVIIEELYPGTEMDKMRLRNALTRLRYFLRIGTK